MRLKMLLGALPPRPISCAPRRRLNLRPTRSFMKFACGWQAARLGECSRQTDRVIEVVLDKTAAPAEVQAVKQAFEDAGLLAEVSADLEHASATLPPWVIYVTVATASLFFSGFVPAAGADAWNGLRDLVGKLY